MLTVPGSGTGEHSRVETQFDVRESGTEVVSWWDNVTCCSCWLPTVTTNSIGRAEFPLADSENHLGTVWSNLPPLGVRSDQHQHDPARFWKYLLTKEPRPPRQSSFWSPSLTRLSPHWLAGSERILKLKHLKDSTLSNAAKDPFPASSEFYKVPSQRGFSAMPVWISGVPEVPTMRLPSPLQDFPRDLAVCPEAPAELAVKITLTQ